VWEYVILQWYEKLASFFVRQWKHQWQRIFDFVWNLQFQESRPRDFPYSAYPKFDYDQIDESECLAELRVRKQEITLLTDVLQLPVTIRCHQRTTCDRTEALCMLLKRFSYPWCRYSDMIHRFARPVPEINMITNSDESYIFEPWSSLMEPSDQFFWPGQHQRIVYNGHKRVHSLKFPSVALPNGLIGNMYEPVGKLCSLARTP